MQSLTHTATNLDTPLADLSHEMARLVERFVPEDGLHLTAIPGLKLARATTPSLPMQTVYDPCLCIIAQGRKEIRLGDELYVYDPLNYLVASVVLPVTGRVIEASPEAPYLSLALEIDPALISSLLTEMPPIPAPDAASQRALFLDRLDPRLLDAVIRLLRLLETPRDIAMLAPLALREIFYRMLLSPQGIACMRWWWPTARASAFRAPSSGCARTSISRCASKSWRARSTSALDPAPSLQGRHGLQPAAVPEAAASAGGAPADALRQPGSGGGQLSRGLREPLAVQPRVQPPVRRPATARHRTPAPGGAEPGRVLIRGPSAWR